MTKQNVFKGVTAVQRSLVDYWCLLRESGDVPSRESIDPGHLRSVLASISIVEFDESGAGRFRIAGSRLRDLLGFEARGRSVEEVAGTAAETFALGLSAAIERAMPVGGVIESGEQLHAWLRLPLAGPDGRISQVLCHDEVLASRRLLTPPAGAAIPPDSDLFAA